MASTAVRLDVVGHRGQALRHRRVANVLAWFDVVAYGRHKLRELFHLGHKCVVKYPLTSWRLKSSATPSIQRTIRAQPMTD